MPGEGSRSPVLSGSSPKRAPHGQPQPSGRVDESQPAGRKVGVESQVMSRGSSEDSELDCTSFRFCLFTLSLCCRDGRWEARRVPSGRPSFSRPLTSSPCAASFLAPRDPVLRPPAIPLRPGLPLPCDASGSPGPDLSSRPVALHSFREVGVPWARVPGEAAFASVSVQMAALGREQRHVGVADSTRARPQGPQWDVTRGLAEDADLTSVAHTGGGFSLLGPSAPGCPTAFATTAFQASESSQEGLRQGF
ncbi:unnamed protein product [Rangifer tarandus platyrhynchus]|uniref:Uncharacterized protein n=1 Tax=Rangifer tarandus platyrhynchus TaxID=3082113 RepID=A0AC59YPH3_RANTA